VAVWAMRHGIMRRMSRAPTLDAPVGLLPLPRPLMIGEVLDAAFRLFRAGILRTLPYSGLMVLILEIPSMYDTFFGAGIHMPLAYAAAFFVAVPVLGVIVLRLNAVANGLRPRFRLEIGAALRRWLPAVIATVGAFAIPVALTVLGPAFTNGLSSEAIAFLATLLFWPTAFFVVTLPVFWGARLGPIAAIAHSLRISVRRSWRMVGAILSSLCVVGVFALLASMIVGMATSAFGSADLFLGAIVVSLLYLVVGAFGVPFVLAVLIVAHQDLELRHHEWQGARP
jgi:hypothetical protein